VNDEPRRVGASTPIAAHEGRLGVPWPVAVEAAGVLGSAAGIADARRAVASAMREAEPESVARRPAPVSAVMQRVAPVIAVRPLVAMAIAVTRRGVRAIAAGPRLARVNAEHRLAALEIGLRLVDSGRAPGSRSAGSA
jgi:hypothetical protein